MATVVKGYLKAPFSIATTPRGRGGCYFFLWIAPLILGTYLIMLSVKQGGIKYHFLSLWYDSTWDWTPVSQAIGEHSTTKPMGWSIGIINRVFANGPGDRGSIPGWVIPKTQKLDAALLNTQHYKVRIKCEVEQSRERSKRPSQHLGVVVIEKGTFRLPLTKVTNFTFTFTLLKGYLLKSLCSARKTFCILYIISFIYCLNNIQSRTSSNWADCQELSFQEISSSNAYYLHTVI